MARPSFPAVLQAHDRMLRGAVMPAGAKHRIAARLAAEASARSGHRRWIPILAFAAGAALVLAVVAMRFHEPTSGLEAVPAGAAPETVASYAVQGSECVTGREGSATSLAGECRLVGRNLTIQTWDNVQITPGARTVTLAQGQATFDVERVPAGAEPVRVVVSHGTVEVLGTRFTIDQGDAGGTVDLFEGHIRFHPADPSLSPVDIQPGQRYAWGDRAAPNQGLSGAGTVSKEPPQSEDEAVDVRGDELSELSEIEATLHVTQDAQPVRVRHQARRRRGAEDADALVDSVTKLRAAGRYAEAVHTLRRALRSKWAPRTRQVLSYELGQLLDRHTDDASAACAHWQTHQRQFPAGRYAGAVEKSLRACR